MPSHSIQFYGLVAALTIVSGVVAFWHAQRNWEGLPPLLDALFSMAGFVIVLAAFWMGAQIGAMANNHPHAGRVIAVAAALLGLRLLRAMLGKEQASQRAKKG